MLDKRRRASVLAINGTARVASALTGIYSYNDAEGDAEGASRFQWCRENAVIRGATNRTYTVVAADVGKALRFE